MKYCLHALRLTAAATALLAAPAAMHAQQTIYVSTASGTVDTVNNSNGTTSVYKTLATGYDPNSPGGYPNIDGLAFDPSGNLYAANETTNTINKITPSGIVSNFAALPTGPMGAQASGIAFGANGNLYTANFALDSISLINPAGATSLFANLPSGSGPNDLAFNGAGNLFVANYNTGTVDEITNAGNISIFHNFGNLAGTDGLAFDKNGNLFVAQGNTGEIDEIKTGGAVTPFAQLGGDASPVGMVFDKDGNLLVAEVDSIVSIDSNGAVSTVAADANTPNFLALGPAPIPEPSTWVMLLGAAGVLGAARRLRRSGLA